MGILAQIAELTAQLYAARRQETGRECEVVVRREIEVVGYLQLEAVASRMTEAREQQSALAFIADGKGDIGRVENGHVLDAHGHTVRGAFLCLGIDVERRGLQHPVLVADRTRGVAHLAQRQLAVRQYVDVFRIAAAVAVHELKVRAVEIGRAIDVVAAGVAADAQFRILEIHAAFDGNVARLVVVGHRIRGHAARVLANLDATVQHGIAVGVDLGLVAVDVNPMIVRRDVGCDRGLVLGRSGAHVAGADHAGRREAGDGECGTNMNRHGQNSSP